MRRERTTNKDYYPKSLIKINKMNDIQRTTHAVCTEYSVTEDQLKAIDKSDDLDLARVSWAMALYECVTNNKCRIARIMGRKGHASTYRFLSRGEDLYGSNKLFKTKLDRILAKSNNEI